jgi:regulator of replication initiation timing
MKNVEVSAQSVINNLLEQNKALVLEVATLKVAIAELSKEIENTQPAPQGEEINE